MGYTTYFNGELTLSRTATEKEVNYINDFSGTRRMAHNVSELFKTHGGKYGHPTPKSNTPQGIYGIDGEYFCKDDRDLNSVVDFNKPPRTQPGLWCQWVLEEDGDYLMWDGGEKFYEYVTWLEYLIKNFFEPWGIKLNGVIDWSGEEDIDLGKIVVVDNIVTVKNATITYD